MRPGLAGASAMVWPFKNERLQLFEQLQTRKIPAAGEREVIVDLRHLHAQSADVERKIAQHFLAPETMDERQRLLRFAQGKDRHEDAAAAREGALDRFRPAAFLGRARESFRLRRVTARAFHDQDVDPALRKDGALRDRLVVEVHVAAVEKRPPFRAQKHTGRAEHMAGIDELKGHAAGRRAFALQAHRLPKAAGTPALPSRGSSLCG